MPKLIINKQLLETLCGYQANLEEISSILKLPQKEVKKFIKSEYGLNFAQFYNKYSAAGKVKLRENMFQLSKKSPDMARYLSEKYLKNEPEITSSLQNQPESEQVLSKISKKIMDLLQNDVDFLQLKVQHRSFLLNYLTTKNATESALKAEYPKTSAYSQGARLLKNAKIASLVDKYSRLEADLASDEKEQLIEELHEIKELAKNLFKFNEAIAAIKQISSMRGFDAPKEIKTNLTIGDVLKEQESEETIDLDSV